MKERIFKALICIVIIPFLWIILIIIAMLILFLPLYAFMYPDKITIEGV